MGHGLLQSSLPDLTLYELRLNGYRENIAATSKTVTVGFDLWAPRRSRQSCGTASYPVRPGCVGVRATRRADRGRLRARVGVILPRYGRKREGLGLP